MKKLQGFIGQELKWSQLKGRPRRFELRAGEEVLATLRWEKGWGSLATGEAVEGSWTFKRSGFMRPRVSVRVAGTETDAALFDLGWSGSGSVRFPSGRSYRWTHLSFWRTQWGFTTESGTQLIGYKPERSWTKLRAHMHVDPSLRSLPEISLLATLGFYLMVLISDDSAAAVAATS